MAGLILSSKYNYLKDKPDASFFKYFTTKDVRCQNVYKNASDEMKTKYKEMCDSISDDFVRISHDIADYRNDINHFGMRKNPIPNDTLRDLLKKKYDQVKALMVWL